jgi:hypothetical protein
MGHSGGILDPNLGAPRFGHDTLDAGGQFAAVGFSESLGTTGLGAGPTRKDEQNYEG